LRIAYQLAQDGGLELLVKILARVSPASNLPASLERFTYSATLLCLANVAIRGNQRLRKRLVEAGVVPNLIILLKSVVTVLQQSHAASLLLQQQQEQQQIQPQQQLEQDTPQNDGENEQTDLNSQSPKISTLLAEASEDISPAAESSNIAVTSNDSGLSAEGHLTDGNLAFFNII
jgi:hypothetical protein